MLFGKPLGEITRIYRQNNESISVPSVAMKLEMGELMMAGNNSASPFSQSYKA